MWKYCTLVLFEQFPYKPSRCWEKEWGWQEHGRCAETQAPHSRQWQWHVRLWRRCQEERKTNQKPCFVQVSQLVSSIGLRRVRNQMHLDLNSYEKVYFSLYKINKHEIGECFKRFWWRMLYFVDVSNSQSNSLTVCRFSSTNVWLKWLTLISYVGISVHNTEYLCILKIILQISIKLFNAFDSFSI